MSELQPLRLRIADAYPATGFRQRWPVATQPGAEGETVGEEAEDLFTAGYRQGFAEAEKGFADERARTARVLAACKALQPEPSEELALLIAETVERLVRCTVGEAAIDAELLLDRARRAASLVAEANGARTLHLNPEDLELLDRNRLPLAVKADPSLSPGCVRIEDSAGWVEDGIATHLDVLRQQLGLDGAEQ
jgi:flagellar assembly protein FliH